MKYHISHSLDETQQIAADWLNMIAQKYGNLDEALVVGLSGHLGAGKTAFTKAVARELGIKEEITSPSFVIMKKYEVPRFATFLQYASEEQGQASQGKSPRWWHLVHIDAYRLEKPEEMEALGYEKLVADKNNLTLIEWPENVGIKDCREGAHIKFEIRDGGYVIAY